MPFPNQKFQEIMSKARDLHFKDPEKEENYLRMYENEDFSSEQILEFQIELAYSFLTQSKTSQALEIYYKMYKKADKMGNNEFMADALEGIGNCKVDAGDLNEAEKDLQKSIAHYSLLNLPDKKSKACNTLAVLYYMRGETDHAIHYYDRSMALATDKKSIRYISAVGNSGLIYHTRGEMDKALELYTTAINISKEKEYTIPYLVYKENLADVLRELGKFEEAQEHFEEALLIANNMNERKIIASVSATYAYYWIERGFFDKAYEYLQTALKIFKEINFMFGLVNFYSVYALYWLGKGNLLHAIDALQNSLKYMEESGVKDSKCEVLTIFSEVYEALGETDKAYECLIEADDFAHERNSPSEHSRVLLERARININQNNVYESIMILKEAYPLAIKSEDFDQKFTIDLLNAKAYLILYGRNPQDEEKYTLAFQNVQKALNLVKDLNLIPKYLQALSVLGLLYLIKGDFDQSQKTFTEAQNLANEYKLIPQMQKNQERIAFAIKNPDDIKNNIHLQKFILDIAVEDLHNITSSFIKPIIKDEDIRDSFIVVYKEGENKELNIHTVSNISLDNQKWKNVLIHFGSLYSLAFGLDSRNQQEILGPFPIGEENYRSIIYTKNKIEDNHESSIKLNILICLVFPERITSLFNDRDKLSEIFSQFAPEISHIEEITSDYLSRIQNSIFDELLKDILDASEKN